MGTLCSPSDVCVRSFLSSFILIKLCYTKALEWSSLVPGSETKSSLEIMNPTPFTVSYQNCNQYPVKTLLATQVALLVKNPPANTEDIRDEGLVPGSGRSPGGGRGNPLQCSCLENPMDRGAWRATVHGVAKCWTRLKRRGMHTHRKPKWKRANKLLFPSKSPHHLSGSTFTPMTQQSQFYLPGFSAPHTWGFRMTSSLT